MKEKRYHHLYKSSQNIAAILLVTAVLLTGMNPTAAASLYPLNITVISNTKVLLSWADNLSEESFYKVERKTDSGDYTELAALSKNSTEYYDLNVSLGPTYTYRVRYIDAFGLPQNYSEEVSVTTANIDSPGSLTVTPVSSTRMNLTWTYPASKSYATAIERRTNGGSWTVVVNIEKGIGKYSDTGLSSDASYFYRVRAVSGPYMHTMTYPNDDIGIGNATFSDKPTNLYGNAMTSSSVYLSWTDNSLETSFIIERKPENFSDFSVIGIVASNTASWIDVGLTPNTKYIYRVKAVLKSGYVYSDEMTVRTVTLDKPTNIVAVATSDSQIELRWTDNSNTETGYEIWRKDGDLGEWKAYAFTGRNAKNYIDRNLSPGSVYYYRVRGIISHSSVYSAFSNDTNAWTIILSPPEDLDYTVTSTSGVNLSWTDRSSGENGFKVERKKGVDGIWEEVATLSAGSTGYIDSGLTMDSQYFYRIKVYDDIYYNSIAYSDEVEVEMILPKSPSNLTAETVSSSQIKLTWSDNSENESGFKIERKLSGKAYEDVAVVKANLGSYLDHDLNPNTKYSYRVRAYNKIGNTVYCTEKSAATKEKILPADIPESYWAKNAITNLISRGVFKTKTKGLFGPTDKVTRGEFVSALVKAFKLNKIDVGTFADVNTGHIYYKEIMTAKKMGIIPLSGNNRFYPDQPILREDAAILVVRTLKAIDKPLPAYDISILEEFSDRNLISTKALYYMATVCGEKIYSGKAGTGGRKIAPKEATSRAEAAAIIYKVIDKE